MLYFVLATVISAVVFPTPLSTTVGWHPLNFEKEHLSLNTAERIEFSDSNYVLWKSGDRTYSMRPDVCPHQGSKLSGAIIKEGSIICPYHGLEIGPNSEAPPPCKETVGVCEVSQGIIWWSHDKKSDKKLIPYCEKLDENPDSPLCRFTTDISASFSDCFKNSMDFHHAAFVHKNTFGNYAGEPSLIEERWNVKGELEGNFLYGSNEVYATYTGGTTENSHVYCEPSTTYNIVLGKDGKYMIIHVAMRALRKYKTRWFLTSSSNFVPGGPIGRAILERMTKKVAIEEDGVQLSKMATDEEKIEHSFKFALPLDTIYGAWNKKYESAEELESSIETSKNVELVAEKLKVYNDTINTDYFPLIRNTQWNVVYSPHLFPGCEIIEQFYGNSANSRTKLKNGTVIIINGSVEQNNNNSLSIKDLTGEIHITENERNTIPKLPFTEHSFEIHYLSKNILLRKGTISQKWEIMKRSNFSFI